eukprot:2079128-Pyramimonas_sp.AAC.1
MGSVCVGGGRRKPRSYWKILGIAICATGPLQSCHHPISNSCLANVRSTCSATQGAVRRAHITREV